MTRVRFGEGGRQIEKWPSWKAKNGCFFEIFGAKEPIVSKNAHFLKKLTFFRRNWIFFENFEILEKLLFENAIKIDFKGVSISGPTQIFGNR